MLFISIFLEEEKFFKTRKPVRPIFFFNGSHRTEIQLLILHSASQHGHIINHCNDFHQHVSREVSMASKPAITWMEALRQWLRLDGLLC